MSAGLIFCRQNVEVAREYNSRNYAKKETAEGNWIILLKSLHIVINCAFKLIVSVVYSSSKFTNLLERTLTQNHSTYPYVPKFVLYILLNIEMALK